MTSRFPSPLVMLSVVAIAMATIAFAATRNPAPTERRIETVSRDAVASATPTLSAKPTPTSKPKPAVERSKIYVEVFNNSGIKGLAASTGSKAATAGWQVVGEDNWYGTVPEDTVYFPARLREAAKLLALDLGIRRIAPAVDPMKMDRLTVILTG